MTCDVCWYIGMVGALIVHDIILGVAAAAKNGNLSSKVMREGMFHKGAEIAVVALACLIEGFMTNAPEMPFTLPLVKPASAYLALMEVASVIENIVLLNPDLENAPVFNLFKGKSEN